MLNLHTKLIIIHVLESLFHIRMRSIWSRPLPSFRVLLLSLSWTYQYECSEETLSVPTQQICQSLNGEAPGNYPQTEHARKEGFSFCWCDLPGKSTSSPWKDSDWRVLVVFRRTKICLGKAQALLGGPGHSPPGKFWKNGAKSCSFTRSGSENRAIAELFAHKNDPKNNKKIRSVERTFVAGQEGSSEPLKPLGVRACSQFLRINGACAHYVMVSKIQWKPFWLATQRDPQNDWTATQNRVNY